MAQQTVLFDVAVLIRTMLRPTLAAAVQSIFAQRFGGTVQILIGIDAAQGDRSVIDPLRQQCPSRMRVDVFELPYPTSENRGGVYSNQTGGVLPVLLAYVASARHIVYLDDDNWVAPDHLDALFEAVAGFDWAFTLRWMVDAVDDRLLGVDEWESVGPGKGAFAVKAGGFVDPNCMIIDKLACHFSLPWFALTMLDDGTSSDRNLFRSLANGHSVGWTDKPTVYYRIRPDDSMNGFRAKWLATRGVATPNWTANIADIHRSL